MPQSIVYIRLYTTIKNAHDLTDNATYTSRFMVLVCVRLASRLVFYAPETRTAVQRETARRHRAVLERSEFAPQEGLEPPTS